MVLSPYGAGGGGGWGIVGQALQPANRGLESRVGRRKRLPPLIQPVYPTRISALGVPSNPLTIGICSLCPVTRSSLKRLAGANGAAAVAYQASRSEATATAVTRDNSGLRYTVLCAPRRLIRTMPPDPPLAAHSRFPTIRFPRGVIASATGVSKKP